MMNVDTAVMWYVEDHWKTQYKWSGRCWCADMKGNRYIHRHLRDVRGTCECGVCIRDGALRWQ
jgi:hypothetical protein